MEILNTLEQQEKQLLKNKQEANLLLENIKLQEAAYNHQKLVGIKDYTFNLTTNDLSFTTFITKPINAELCALIITTNKPVQLRVDLLMDDNNDILLFSTQNNSLTGTTYLPLRMNAISSDFERFNFSNVAWALNDRLRFTLEGQKDTICKIKVRVK